MMPGGNTPMRTMDMTVVGSETDKQGNTPMDVEDQGMISKPIMTSLSVTSKIEHRFASTLIISKMTNPARQAQEIFFSTILPDSAFISKFILEVDGKEYEAYVKEKEEAKQVYNEAREAGFAAAHVSLSARDSNRFTVSVNIKANSNVAFKLTYEELLTRRLGAYNHVINLDPGQVVPEFLVKVSIKESRDIIVLRVPELRSGNEVDANEQTKANPLATIDRKLREAHIVFSPTPEQQRVLAQTRVTDNDAAKVGIGGQFVVQYDVNRDPQGGQVLLNNGFFVHFFAPQNLQPLRKHAIFTLDVSGSMSGRKIEQLKQAMEVILDDLNEGDSFSIVEFSSDINLWNLDDINSGTNRRNVFPAVQRYITEAKARVSRMQAGGGTNISEALITSLRVSHQIPNQPEDKLEPIIVFLTDGCPCGGETRLENIMSIVQELNVQPKASIFSLAFGDDADLQFLKKLSLKNSGFAKKIYLASDAALQLRDFYRQISSPLLSNVRFNYVPEMVLQEATTRINFHTLFSGSEFVIAGKLKTNSSSSCFYDVIEGDITGISATGNCNFPITDIQVNVVSEVSSLERLWAYLTIKQLLEHESDDVAQTKKEKDDALRLALKYSFVTPLTSLVVVKPEESKETGFENVINPASADSLSQGAFTFGSAALGPPQAMGFSRSPASSNFSSQGARRAPSFAPQAMSFSSSPASIDLLRQVRGGLFGSAAGPPPPMFGFSEKLLSKQSFVPANPQFSQHARLNPQLLHQQQQQQQQLLDSVEGESQSLPAVVRTSSVVDEDGNTELHIASADGLTDKVRALLDQGSDIEALNKESQSALWRASYWGRLDVVRILVERGASMIGSKMGNSPLHVAAQQGHLDVVMFLIEAGADVNARNKLQDTPLHRAAFNGQREIVKYLVEHGADHQAVNKVGIKSLDEAVNAGFKEIADYLAAI